ncbi:hypothetical protein MMC20_008038 [Loxospora ochrophaea]|nr:hypothetical protein [Loxospora ochrophaea]
MAKRVRDVPRFMEKSRVEGEAQGDEESIKKLLKDLNNGPSLAHVVKLEKSDMDVKEGESGFDIK